MQFTFGRCVVDTDSRELRIGQDLVHLTQKTFQLLEILLRSSPRVVSKSELHERIWKGSYVSDSALSTLIADLRRAIGDIEEPRMIRTAHGFGYCFRAQVSQVAPGPEPSAKCCRLEWSDKSLDLHSGEYGIGRTHESAICVDDPSVSRRHARVVLKGDSVTIEDVGSKNGTYLNERRLTTASALRDGDSIVVGSVRIACRLFTPDGPTLTVSGRDG